MSEILWITPSSSVKYSSSTDSWLDTPAEEPPDEGASLEPEHEQRASTKAADVIRVIVFKNKAFVFIFSSVIKAVKFL